MVGDITLEPFGVPDLHLRSQEHPPKLGSVPEGWSNIFFKFWRQRSVIHQIVCIFWDKSNGLVKITYGCHPWDQECPPSIRKVPDNPPSRTYLLSDISVLFIICYVFSKTNPTRGSVLVKECHPYPMVQEGSWSSSIRKILHEIFFRSLWVWYIKLYVFFVANP